MERLGIRSNQWERGISKRTNGREDNKTLNYERAHEW